MRRGAESPCSPRRRAPCRLLAFAGEAAAQAGCPVKVGGILPLTGSMAPITKKIAQAAELAFEHVNQGGGVKGCPVQFILRDDQGQPTVGVDAAKYLVEVESVPAFTGTISLGRHRADHHLGDGAVEGRADHAAARPRARSRSTAAAAATSSAPSRPARRRRTPPAVGDRRGAASRRPRSSTSTPTSAPTCCGFYKAAVAKLGGEIVVEVPYNDNQPSYRAEVTRALAAKPESMLLIGFPKDAVTIVREWLSLGGTKQIALNNSMRTHGLRQRRRREVRRGLLRHGQRPGRRPARRRLQQGVRGQVQDRQQGARRAHAVRRGDGDGAGDEHRQGPDAARRSRTRCARCTRPDGTPVGTGPAEFKKALELIKAGKPIKYFGATGPIEFDANGDVTGPALVWKIKDGQIVTDRIISIEEMQALFKRVEN